MPGFDGTGPMGLGPMTGGGRGFCNPYNPLRTAGFAPPVCWPRSVAALPAAFNPAVSGSGPGSGPGYFPCTWFGMGVRPRMVGGLPGFWRGRGGRGRGGGHGGGGLRFPRYSGYPY